MPWVWVDTGTGWPQIVTTSAATTNSITSSIGWNLTNSSSTYIHPYLQPFVQQGAAQMYNQPPGRIQQYPPLPNRLDRQLQEVDRVLARREAATVRGHPTEAQERARELLLSHLTPEQRASFESHKWFIVEGGRSKTKYRINVRDDLIANIDQLGSDGKRTLRLCAHLDKSRLPLGDHLLAQKLMLECSEDHFLRVANRHHY